MTMMLGNLESTPRNWWRYSTLIPEPFSPLSVIRTFPHITMNPAAHLEEDYDFERRYWYYGLHSWPQMLARSPHGLPFARQSCYDAGYPASKALIPIDPQHPICRAWRDGLDEEVIVVLSALLPCAWSVVPLRIGENPRFAHTVLFVAVEEGSTTTAEQGKEAVARLVALLESKGLIDVDVEVHESSYIELGRLYDHTDLYFAYGSRDDEPDRSRVHLSSAIGAQISLINDPRRYGTANAWLDCGPPERRERFLLTCGHVLREDEAGSATGHGAKSNASRARPVAQFIGENFDDCVQECKSRIESTLWTMAKLNERYGTAGDCNSWPSLSSQAMRTAKSKHEEYRLLLDEVTQKFGEAHQHIIGDLHATSARLMAYEGSSWMCDWALIRPDPEVFRGLTINERSSTSFTGIVNPKEPLSDGTAVPSHPNSSVRSANEGVTSP